MPNSPINAGETLVQELWYPFYRAWPDAPLCRAIPFDVFYATFRPSLPWVLGLAWSMEGSWSRLRPVRTLLGRASTAPVGIHSASASTSASTSASASAHWHCVSLLFSGEQVFAAMGLFFIVSVASFIILF